MSDISQWNPVDASNNASPPDGFPEGMSASAVNDSSRAVMGSVRRHAEDGGWFDWGHSASYVNPTTFQVPGDLSLIYTVGRRVRITQTATVYGSIASVAVSANTDVTVTLDDGATIANEAMTVSVGFDSRVTASSAGSFLVHEEIDMAGQTQYDIQLDPAYDYRFEVLNAEPSTGTLRLYCSMSTDGFIFDAGSNYVYSVAGNQDGVAIHGFVSPAPPYLTSAQTAGGSNRAEARVTVRNHDSADSRCALFVETSTEQVGSFVYTTGTLAYTIRTAIQALRVYWDTSPTWSIGKLRIERRLRGV